MSTRAGVVALASSAMLASFLQTIMTPLVPELPSTFGVSAGQASWVLTAPLLAACATAPVTGRIGDRLGRRSVLVALLALILVGSVVGALSHSLTGVIAARAIQGVGLGVMGLNVSVIRDVVPSERRAGAVAAVSASNGIGGALGLPLSATISEFFDWHGLFWLAAVLAAASGMAILVTVPHTAPATRSRFDVPGAAGLIIGLPALILAVAQGADWGWLSLPTLACAVGGVGVLALWAMHELRSPYPLVDLRLLFRGTVLTANLVSVAVGFTWFAIPGLVARKLQSIDGAGPGLGLDMVTASIVIVPTGLTMLLAAPLAQWLLRRAGARFACVAGGLATSAAYAIGLFAGEQVWQIAVVAALVGIGSVLVFTSLPLVIMTRVPAGVTATANSINAVMRWLGSTLASAILGAVLAAHTFLFDGGPVPAAGDYGVSFALALGIGLAGAALATRLPRAR